MLKMNGVQIFHKILIILLIIIGTYFILSLSLGIYSAYSTRIKINKYVEVKGQAFIAPNSVVIISSEKEFNTFEKNISVNTGDIPKIDFNKWMWIVSKRKIESISRRNDGVFTYIRLTGSAKENHFFITCVRKFKSSSMLRVLTNE